MELLLGVQPARTRAEVLLRARPDAGATELAGGAAAGCRSPQLPPLRGKSILKARMSAPPCSFPHAGRRRSTEWRLWQAAQVEDELRLWRASDDNVAICIL
ncbi:hypothetical protein PVAP13_9KG248400 [Panicum virgatum]|uniref:Uncharacterized protein n=1 Tax=Panicum virgatum TaxID=38727 RepID=A0A8T0NK69_PANVG|nr:hypothetical protein PVAP13_9KG248400 [Panicum virgatum]